MTPHPNSMAHGDGNARIAAFAFEDSIVGVRTPSATIARSVARLVPAYVADIDPARLFQLHDLEQTDGGWAIVESGGARQSFPEWPLARDALEHLIVTDLLRCASRMVHLHAAGAATAAGAIVALGASGAGKSTLAFAWSMLGRPVFGDDVTLIDDEGNAHAFRRLFTVDRKRLADFGGHARTQLTLLGDSDEAWFNPSNGADWAEPQPILRVAVVRYDPAGPLTMKPLGAAEVLAALSASIMPTGLSSTAAFDRLVEISRSSQGVDVSFCDAREAAVALMKLS